ncbi:MAG: tetratricopeptide repeat protein, partial [Candidatus Omnitrophica bacterium]|nr:tetratricopeptide repeat protein [Candidatus Omnitrophota bacterium]
MQKTIFGQKISLILFGIFLCLVFMEAGLRIGGFIIISLREHRNMISFSKANAYSIVCLGESTTAIGGEDSWPAQLEVVLNAKKNKTSFKVMNEGREDIDTSVILSNLENILNKYNPNMLIIMTGINDTASTAKYEDGRIVNIKQFFSGFRVYKLARNIRLHLINKVKELGSYKSNEDIRLPKKEYIESSNFKDNRQKKDKETEDGFKKALKLDPENSSVYSDLGNLYNGQNKYQQAEEMFKQAIRFDPHNRGAYDGLGVCYSEQGKYIEAEEMFKKAIRLDPENSSVYSDLGNLYNRQNKYQQAEEMFKQAIRLDPENSSAYDGLGAGYVEKRKYKEAEDLFEIALKLDPENSSVYSDLGNLYNGQNKYQQAEEMFKQAIRFDPHNRGAYDGLGVCYSEQGKYKMLDDLLTKIIKINEQKQEMEEEASPDFIEGYTYLGQKDYRQAEEAFKKALQL